MTPAVRDELAWAIRHAEHEYAVALAQDPVVQANAMFWFGASHGLKLAIQVGLGHAALVDVLMIAYPDFVGDDGMAVTA